MGGMIKYQAIRDTLSAAEDAVAGILPIAHRSQASRFIKRALLTISTLDPSIRERVENCDVKTIVEAVLNAAECGFAIDGRFAYIIPYGNVAQCQFDYKAIIAMAKRSGAILDARAEVVKQNDEFDWHEENGQQVYRYKPATGDRGETVGAFSVLILPSGHYRFMYMERSELDKVQKASKAPNSPAWTNWEGQMHCKAVTKRNLKGMLDDPGLIEAIAIDDREYDLDKPLVIPEQPSSITNELNAATGNGQPGPVESGCVKLFCELVPRIDDIEDLESARDAAMDQTEYEEEREAIQTAFDDRLGALEKE